MESKQLSYDQNHHRVFKTPSFANASNASRSKGSKRRRKKHYKTAEGNTFIESSIYKKNQHAFRLTADSHSMGFAAFLKKEYLNGLDPSYKLRANIYMNCLIVHLAQIFMIMCVTRYALINPDFNTVAPNSASILVARFMASM